MINALERTLSSAQLRQLEDFGGKVNKFSARFAVCNVNGELILLCDGGEKIMTSEHSMPNGDSEYAKYYIAADLEGVYRFGRHNQFLAAALKSGGETVATALIDLGDKTANQHTGYDLWDAMLSEMLELFADKFRAEAKADEQINMLSSELAKTYEELVLIHKLSTNMRINKPDANYLQMACDSLTDIVDVEGIAILLKKTIDNEEQLVIAAGSGLIDINEQMAWLLYERLAEQISSGKEAILDSEVDSPFKYSWPDNIKNIIAVPLCGKDKSASGLEDELHNRCNIIGLMVAVNIVDKPDFDSTDIKLFDSVVNGCAVFIENSNLFKDLEELFVGSLRALTSSIDAKDPYTRGHSERVALISRWIAEALPDDEALDEEQISKVYLAGLLHDIGKLGVKESVLCKKGKLTDEEYGHIKAHSPIGAGILSEMKQMRRDIVPGVLNHHERVDGKGYPQGLIGEQIPLMGRIIAVADSFDAMTSERTYRGALTVEQALEEIEKGLGTQFDEKVARAFIDSDVYRLWDIMQGGFTETYGAGNLSQYSSAAVGALIR